MLERTLQDRTPPFQLSPVQVLKTFTPITGPENAGNSRESDEGSLVR